MPDDWCQMTDAKWLMPDDLRYVQSPRLFDHFFLGITTLSGLKQHDASAIVNDLWFFSFNHGCFLLPPESTTWSGLRVLYSKEWNDQSHFGASIWEAGIVDYCI